MPKPRRDPSAAFVLRGSARCQPETRNKIKQRLCFLAALRLAIGQQQQRTQLQRGFIHAALPGRLLLRIIEMCDVRCARCGLLPSCLTARHPGPKRAPDSADDQQILVGDDRLCPTTHRPAAAFIHSTILLVIQAHQLTSRRLESLKQQGLLLLGTRRARDKGLSDAVH